MTEWIRVADKLPTHTDEVLAFDPEQGIVLASYLHGLAYGWSWWCDDDGGFEPTHWMPLPEPPQTENHELPTAESNAE